MIYLLILELVKATAITSWLGPVGDDGNDRILSWIYWISYASTYWCHIRVCLADVVLQILYSHVFYQKKNLIYPCCVQYNLMNTNVQFDVWCISWYMQFLGCVHSFWVHRLQMQVNCCSCVCHWWWIKLNMPFTACMKYQVHHAICSLCLHEILYLSKVRELQSNRCQWRCKITWHLNLKSS